MKSDFKKEQEEDRRKVKESYDKWFEMIDELKWQQACEEEANFEKACDMAKGFLPVKTEEDRRFMEEWLDLDPTIEKPERKIKVPDNLSSQLK